MACKVEGLLVRRPVRQRLAELLGPLYWFAARVLYFDLTRFTGGPVGRIEAVRHGDDGSIYIQVRTPDRVLWAAVMPGCPSRARTAWSCGPTSGPRPRRCTWTTHGVGASATVRRSDSD